MLKIRGAGLKRRGQGVWWPILIALAVSQAHAGPLGLPDSARPGAVRPDTTPAAAPKAPPQAGVEVPPVIDRPLGVDEGPRVQVAQFELVDARDLPRYKVKVSEIQSLVDAKGATYTEGLTIGQMQEVAEVVTQYYREKGLILAQAVVPVQTVQGGVIKIQVYEGKLGRVIPEGNSMYSNVVLEGPFKKLIGEPVTKDDIESALLQLTDFPGLTVFGVFQPGQLVGVADLVLRVQEEKRFDVAYRADNHGIKTTGRHRFRPTFEWNNVTGGADHAAVTVQQSYTPKNNTYLSFDYDRYLGLGFKAGAYYNKNDFDVGGDLKERGISGKTIQMGTWLDKSWFRSRQFNFSTRVELARKESRTFVKGDIRNRDRLSVLSFSGMLDQVDTRFKGINFATVEVSHGFNNVFGAMGSAKSALDYPTGYRPGRQGGSGDFAAGEFTKLFATASRLQTVRKNTSLLMRTEFQWSDDLLVPMEQYSVGGPDNLRAYGPAEVLLDRAWFMSAEVIQNMPFITDVRAFGNRTWGELIQLSAFYDVVMGKLNDPLSSEKQGYVNFQGAGVQLRFTLPGKIESRIIGAWSLTRDAGNNRQPQAWADFTYRF